MSFNPGGGYYGGPGYPGVPPIYGRGRGGPPQPPPHHPPHPQQNYPTPSLAPHQYGHGYQPQAQPMAPPPMPVGLVQQTIYSAAAPRPSEYSSPVYTHPRTEQPQHSHSVRDPGSVGTERSRQEAHSGSKKPDMNAIGLDAQKLLSSLNSSNVNLDALLQDDRLKNVLFAGISKATEKLEKSIKSSQLSSADSVAFMERKQTSSQLFPSAKPAADQSMPRSILKSASSGAGVSSSSGIEMSTLEKTLQILRGKAADTSSAGDITSQQLRTATDALSQLASYSREGALSQLAHYEGEDEATQRGRSKEKEDSGGKSKGQPFWAAPQEMEASKRQTDSFDIQDKMYEQWRKSIHKTEETSQIESLQKKIEAELKNAKSQAGAENINSEEIDSTVQGILHSIGFNFDLSKRMQELAKKKKTIEDNEKTGIVNAAASFLDGKEKFPEHAAASLLGMSKDSGSIDRLIKSARESSKYERVSVSPSPERTVRMQSSDRIRRQSFERDEYLDRGRNPERRSPLRDRTRDSFSDRRSGRLPSASPPRRSDFQHRRSHESPDSRRRGYDYSRDDSRRGSLSRDVATPPRHRLSPGRTKEHSPGRREYGSSSGYRNASPDRGGRNSSPPYLSERFRDQPKDEYFYPEDNDYGAPAVPLLTTRRPRVEEDDLTSGLIPTGALSRSRQPKVENFTVMSKSYQRDNDSETVRRIILPAKSEGSRVKRSASPLSPLPSKARRMIEDQGPMREGQRSPIDSRRYSDDCREPDSRYSSPRRRSPVRDREPSPRGELYGTRQRSPDRFDGLGRSPERRKMLKSPVRLRSRTPDGRRSRTPQRWKRSPSDRRRSRTPPRRRSRSPGRRRSRTPTRRRSRSPGYRRSPDRRRSRSLERGVRRFSARRPDRRSPIHRKPVERRPSKPVPQVSKAKSESQEKKKETPRVNVSKMAPEERKTYLRKLLEEKGVAVPAGVENLAEAQHQTKQLLTLISESSSADRDKILTKLSMKQVEINAQRAKLGVLRKTQNELMRKSQRSGAGINDPLLKENLNEQEEIEKKIATMSTEDITGTVEEVKASIRIEDAGMKQTSTAKSKSDESKGSWKVLNKDGPASKGVVEGGKQNTSDKSKDDSKKESESTSRRGTQASKAAKVYTEFLDGGNHWCKHCLINNNSIEQYFEHSHGKKHITAVSMTTRPWVAQRPKKTSAKKFGRPVSQKVKGIEFMFPMVGFYCSLCKVTLNDFDESTDHAKSEGHFNKYKEYVKVNPKYEKNMLLEKSQKKKGQGKGSAPPPPPPPKQPPTPKQAQTPKQPPLPKGPPPSSETPKAKVEGDKQKTGKKQLRKATKDLGFGDKEKRSRVVQKNDDMDLDVEDDGSGDVDIKVPKMVGKQGPVLPPLPPRSQKDSNETAVSGDTVQPLETFITVKQEGTSKDAELPILSEEMNLASIPIPPKQEVKDEANPSEPEMENSVEPKVLYGAKSLEEIKQDEKRAEDEEKRMMGIDVDAAEEKPMDVVPVAPPVVTAVAGSTEEKTEASAKPKPKSMTSLFAKVAVKTAPHVNKSKLKAVGPEAITADTDLEAKFQQEIQEKILREKANMLKKKEKEQERKRKLEQRLEEKMKKKQRLIYGESDSSSSEDDSEAGARESAASGEDDSRIADFLAEPTGEVEDNEVHVLDQDPKAAGVDDGDLLQTTAEDMIIGETVSTEEEKILLGPGQEEWSSSINQTTANNAAISARSLNIQPEKSEEDQCAVTTTTADSVQIEGLDRNETVALVSDGGDATLKAQNLVSTNLNEQVFDSPGNISQKDDIAQHMNVESSHGDKRVKSEMSTELSVQGVESVEDLDPFPQSSGTGESEPLHSTSALDKETPEIDTQTAEQEDSTPGAQADLGKQDRSTPDSANPDLDVNTQGKQTLKTPKGKTKKAPVKGKRRGPHPAKSQTAGNDAFVSDLTAVIASSESVKLQSTPGPKKGVENEVPAISSTSTEESVETNPELSRPVSAENEEDTQEDFDFGDLIVLSEVTEEDGVDHTMGKSSVEMEEPTQDLDLDKESYVEAAEEQCEQAVVSKSQTNPSQETSLPISEGSSLENKALEILSQHELDTNTEARQIIQDSSEREASPLESKEVTAAGSAVSNEPTSAVSDAPDLTSAKPDSSIVDDIKDATVVEPLSETEDKGTVESPASETATETVPSREASPVPVSREASPVPVSREASPAPVRGGRGKGRRGGRGRGRGRKAAALVPPVEIETPPVLPEVDLESDQPVSESPSRRSTRSRKEPATTPSPCSSERRTRRSAQQAAVEETTSDVTLDVTQEPETLIPSGASELEADTTESSQSDLNVQLQADAVVQKDSVEVEAMSAVPEDPKAVDSDSDATITEGTEDPSSVHMPQPGLDEESQQGHVVASQPESCQVREVRDPPMSGVVTEESVEAVILHMEEEQGGNLASEQSPTEGLTFDMEEEENSMDFVVEGLE